MKKIASGNLTRCAQEEVCEELDCRETSPTLKTYPKKTWQMKHVVTLLEQLLVSRRKQALHAATAATCETAAAAHQSSELVASQ